MSVLDSVEGHLKNVAEGISGLKALYLSDRDGITLAKTTTADSKLDVSKLCAVFSSASEQASKLSLGPNSTIVTFSGEGFTIVQSILAPLVITFVGTGDLNVGLVQKKLPGLRDSLEGVREKVESVISSTS
mmetsp:Transcript_21732/g.35103  ORF Transcript_21732/g.35103 Transcript_21732/m.35103 type:complete len:131 (+) Transcript_21732:53-445(+)|eukprot:jgi/Bigna1/81175/fgenesh1_pg.78_\